MLTANLVSHLLGREVLQVCDDIGFANQVFYVANGANSHDNFHRTSPKNNSVSDYQIENVIVDIAPLILNTRKSNKTDLSKIKLCEISSVCCQCVSHNCLIESSDRHFLDSFHVQWANLKKITPPHLFGFWCNLAYEIILAPNEQVQNNSSIAACYNVQVIDHLFLSQIHRKSYWKIIVLFYKTCACLLFVFQFWYCQI